jgi:hypothetical protein
MGNVNGKGHVGVGKTNVMKPDNSYFIPKSYVFTKCFVVKIFYVKTMIELQMCYE